MLNQEAVKELKRKYTNKQLLLMSNNEILNTFKKIEQSLSAGKTELAVFAIGELKTAVKAEAVLIAELPDNN